MRIQNNNIYEADDVNFAGSATGTEVINLNGRSLMAIQTPASLGATSFTFTAALKVDGTFVPVRNADGNAITITVNTSTAGWTDITDVFPASVQFVKVVANTSLTGKTIQLISRNV